MLGSEHLKTLVKDGYLQSMVEDPGFGPGSADHYVFEDEGIGVTCTVHGRPVPVERAPQIDGKDPLGRAFAAERAAAEGPTTPADAVVLTGPVTAEALELPPGTGSATLADLRTAAKAGRARTRSVAALALRRLRDPRGLPVLHELLADPDEYVRKQAAWSLGQIGGPADHPVLVARLTDPAERVRDFAAFALARLGHPEGLRQSLAVLADTSRNPIRRGEAAQAIGDGKLTSAIPELRRTLAGPHVDPDLKIRVEQALQRLLKKN